MLDMTFMTRLDNMLDYTLPLALPDLTGVTEPLDEVILLSSPSNGLEPVTSPLQFSVVTTLQPFVELLTSSLCSGWSGWLSSELSGAGKFGLSFSLTTLSGSLVET